MIDWRSLRCAQALQNDTFLYIETVSGGGVYCPDPEGAAHLLPLETNDEAVGSATLEALHKSRALGFEEFSAIFTDAAVESHHAAWLKMIMERYRYKSKRELFKTMKRCSLDLGGDSLTIQPSFHRSLETWTEEGITKDDYVVIPAASPANEIGAALRVAFSRCLG